MKKLLLYPSFLLMAVLCMYGCKKSPVDTFLPSRNFSPVSISITLSDTLAIITWPASVNAPASVTYTVQISTDSTYSGSAPITTIITGAVSVKVSDDSLQNGVKYYVRVKANGSGSTADSYWVGGGSTSFTFVGINIFTPLNPNNILDIAAIITWTPTPGVTRLVITGGGMDTTIAITAAMNAAGMDTVYNLKAGTTYTASIFAGEQGMGTETFTTRASITAASVVDLRGITDSMVLQDTLPIIPSGATVLLEAGMRYNISNTTNATLTKDVTIQTGAGFGGNAILSMATNFDASGTLDSITFVNITFATIGSQYVLNYSNGNASGGSIGKVAFYNCASTGNFINSLVRMKQASTTIGTVDIENCVFDSIGTNTSSTYPILFANASNTAIIKNIIVNNSTFYYFASYFIREQTSTAPTSVAINNCTFNAFGSYSGASFFNSTTPPTTLTVSNCIFGSTGGVVTSSSYQGIPSAQNPQYSNCYTTSDCTFTSNSISGAGVTATGVASASLFKSPSTGNFTLTSAATGGILTAGDPRWQ